jgi:hypothetical protein
LIDHDPSTQPNAPVELFPRDHRLAAASHSSMLPCLLLALPEACCAPVLQAVVSQAEQSVLRPSVQAVIAACGLSELEAQSIFVYTASIDFAVCPVHGAPFYSYNSALRGAQPLSVSAWRDYSFLLYSALLKLPPAGWSEPEAARGGGSSDRPSAKLARRVLDDGRQEFNLVRTQHTSTQTRKGRLSRWNNVSNIFWVKYPEQLEHKRVLLVDDVITTGATIEACVSALQKVDGIQVSVASLAIPA